MAQINWGFEAVELLTCNCDWGCPCQFNARPTHGDCRAAGAFRIGTGHFGDTPLDGVIFAWLFAWPGAIHEGKGEGQLIVDENASDAQREAVDDPRREGATGNATQSSRATTSALHRTRYF